MTRYGIVRWTSEALIDHEVCPTFEDTACPYASIKHTPIPV